MKSAGVIEYALRKTPAVIIGNMTSPPPRIARFTLNFLFRIDFGIFLFLYLVFIFCICFLTDSEAEGTKKPPNIFSSSIWNFAIFCMMPLFHTAHAS